MSPRRLLVVGAGGWFGQTLQRMNHGADALLLTASTRRNGYVVWNDEAIHDFQPTTIVNLAFLTQDKLDGWNVIEFEAQNRILLDRFARALQEPSVREVITVSSGAAVTMPQGVYGRLKAEEESIALDWVTGSRTAVVLRAYSMSGALVRDPERYAFSNFVQQARRGVVRVRADRPTYRRYTSVTDLLTVGLAMLARERSGVIESGGELIEMSALARRIIDLVNPRARLEARYIRDNEPHVYASDGESWASACRLLGFKPMDLNAQIRAVRDAL